MLFFLINMYKFTEINRKFEKLASNVMERCFDDSDENTEKIVFANIATPFQLQHPKSIVDVAYGSKCFDFVSHTALRSMVQHRWYASLSPISKSRVFLNNSDILGV